MDNPIISGKTPQVFSPVLTVKDVQKILQIGQVSAYKLIRSKSFPVTRIGRCYRIPSDTFYMWLQTSQLPTEKPLAEDNSCLLAQLRNGGIIYGKPQNKR